MLCVRELECVEFSLRWGKGAENMKRGVDLFVDVDDNHPVSLRPVQGLSSASNNCLRGGRS